MPSVIDVDNSVDRLLTDRDLALLQLSTVLYYMHETNPDNGLVRDKTDPHAPPSAVTRVATETPQPDQ